MPSLRDQHWQDDNNLSAAQRMHTESLVNFVAFNRDQAQRCFLLREGVSPPPPPVKTIQRPGKPRVIGAAALRANHEAQMVLLGTRQADTRGAIVACGLHAQLQNLDIDISEQTYELMVQASVNASCLRTSTMLLTRMESAGKKPSSALFDCVMDLNAQEESEHVHVERVVLPPEVDRQESVVNDSTAPAKLQLSAPPKYQSQMWPDDQQELTSSAGDLVHHGRTTHHDRGMGFPSQDLGEQGLDGGTAFPVPREFMAPPSESGFPMQPTEGQPTHALEATRPAQAGETESYTGAEDDWHPHEDMSWRYHFQEGMRHEAEWFPPDWEWRDGNRAGHVPAPDGPGRLGEGWGDPPYGIWRGPADEGWDRYPQRGWKGHEDVGWDDHPHRGWLDDGHDEWHATQDDRYSFNRYDAHRWTSPPRPSAESLPPVWRERPSHTPWWQQKGAPRGEPWPEVRKMVWKAKD